MSSSKVYFSSDAWASDDDVLDNVGDASELVAWWHEWCDDHDGTSRKFF